ncbi:MAG: hypothetical protein AB4368_29240 [Xenococcaceae cyanobacterium]
MNPYQALGEGEAFGDLFTVIAQNFSYESFAHPDNHTWQYKKTIKHC